MIGESGLSVDAIQQRLAYVALALIAAASWIFLLASERAMLAMRGDGPIMAMMWAMMDPSVVAPYLAASVTMWVVMMVAMMIPAVLPMAMVFRGMHKGRHATAETLLFTSGYLIVWSFFAIIGAMLQWLLHSNGWLRGHLLEAGAPLMALILVAAGLYQLTPLKAACLTHCRSPIGFFMAHWRDGRTGAILMGAQHGLYCLGCCWMLMLLMFVGGAMSVTTMALLSVFILAERLLPAGPWVSRLPGVVMLSAGTAIALGY